MAMTFWPKKKKLTEYRCPVNNVVDKEDSFVSWPTFSEEEEEEKKKEEEKEERGYHRPNRKLQSLCKDDLPSLEFLRSELAVAHTIILYLSILFECVTSLELPSPLAPAPSYSSRLRFNLIPSIELWWTSKPS